MNINDLPGELLDEIFGYLAPWIIDQGITPIYTVCRKWNRPFMTHTLTNDRLPQKIDLQAKFPKLISFGFFPKDAKHCKDFSFFKGHAFLKQLAMNDTGLDRSVLNCPRLISLAMYVNSELFFKGPNLAFFMALLPRIETLDLKLFTMRAPGNVYWNPMDAQKLATIIQARTKQPELKLKSFSISSHYHDFLAFFQLFQTASVASILRNETKNLNLSSLLNWFPHLESLDLGHCPVIFDLEHPTPLTHSKMIFINSVQPCMFSNLKTLDWTMDKAQFNYVMRELGKHCPLLTLIKIHPSVLNQIFQTASSVVPELDNILFPRLVEFELGGAGVMVNSSLARFLSRHGQLESLKFSNKIEVAHDWKPIQCDDVLWPHLRDLEFCPIHGPDNQRKEQMCDWFEENAPNVTDLDFEFKN